MRAANKIEDRPSSELILYLLNAADLKDEVIDFCKNLKASDNQIKHYYMGEALMKIKSDHSFAEMLEKAEITAGNS